MTSIAFIMGVVPLVLSSGAGSEMRHAMGIAVFFGMLGVTLFGLFLTPVFYVLLRKMSGRALTTASPHEAPHVAAHGAAHGGAPVVAPGH
jgi:multidrug efflux pump